MVEAGCVFLCCALQVLTLPWGGLGSLHLPLSCPDPTCWVGTLRVPHVEYVLLTLGGGSSRHVLSWTLPHFCSETLINSGCKQSAV